MEWSSFSNSGSVASGPGVPLSFDIFKTKCLENPRKSQAERAPLFSVLNKVDGKVLCISGNMAQELSDAGNFTAASRQLWFNPFSHSQPRLNASEADKVNNSVFNHFR